MKKIILLTLTGIVLSGIVSCFAKHRRSSQPPTAYVSAAEDTIPDPPPFMDGFNKALIGKWELVSKPKEKRLLDFRSSVFRTDVDRFVFTDQKECTYFIGESKRTVPFTAHPKTIDFKINYCTPPEEHAYELKDSALIFHVTDQNGKPVDLKYIRVE